MEDENLHNNVDIELVHEKEDNESISNQETANKKQKTDSVKSMNNTPETRFERIPCWQKNSTTFYNPEPGREELAENVYLSMLSGYNEPKTL